MLRSSLLFLSLVSLPVSPLAAESLLRFSETELSDVREGYFTLSWNALPDAAEYHVTRSDGQSVYRGPLPEAFVSGLSDGSYQYNVQASNKNGSVIATSDTPAVVVVEHWSLQLALLLFSCGLAVFLTLVGLIIKGTLQTRSASPSASHDGAAHTTHLPMSEQETPHQGESE